jgi:hypothetical protein
MTERKSLLIFFPLAWLISWIIWSPLYLPYFQYTDLPILPYHHALGAAGPMAAALIVSYIEKKLAGIKELINHIFRWRVNLIWYFIALFSPSILFLIATLLSFLIDGHIINLTDMGVFTEFPHFTFTLFFIYNLVAFGWRRNRMERICVTSASKNIFLSNFHYCIICLLGNMAHTIIFLPTRIYQHGFCRNCRMACQHFYRSDLTHMAI